MQKHIFLLILYSLVGFISSQSRLKKLKEIISTAFNKADKEIERLEIKFNGAKKSRKIKEVDYEDPISAHNAFLNRKEDPERDRISRLAMVNTEVLKMAAKEKGL